MNKKSSISPHNQSAFTLIELLTVIAVIAILAAILIPAISNVRKRSASVGALNNARQIGMANLLYSQENQGEILGQGLWADTMHLFDNLTLYMANADKSEITLQLKQNTLRSVVDPNVPNALQSYGQYPYTWSVNSIFNRRYGRGAQGVGPWGTDGQRAVSPRRMLEFEEPSNTLYAVSGGFEFSVAQAEKPELLVTPTGRQPIFYLHGSDDSTPGVFLDGHAELMTYPISARRINPSLPR